jgi:hypothetical protein
MILGGLLGLGISRTAFETELAKLNLSGVSLIEQNVDRSGIAAIHVEVAAPEQQRHRHLSDIVRIIQDSQLDEAVKDRSVAVFTKLAEAEARVHGISVNDVHFHEVGGIDAIVDIVGACIGFRMLGIERFACSKINVGSGFVQMEHGKFPVPPPAVTELLKNTPVFSNEVEGELITPTGAAIIATVSESYGPLPEMQVEQTSYGAGTREYKGFPNVIRLLLGESTPVSIGREQVDDLTLIETNLDDVSPQILGFVMERVFEIGALDCWLTPIQMKKNRPATMFSVLCPHAKRDLIAEVLYTETTTLGLRIRKIERECLQREIVRVKTAYGEVKVKVARYREKVTNAMPEYEDVRRIALEHHVPFKVVHDEALRQLTSMQNRSVAS